MSKAIFTVETENDQLHNSYEVVEEFENAGNIVKGLLYTLIQMGIQDWQIREVLDEVMNDIEEMRNVQ